MKSNNYIALPTYNEMDNIKKLVPLIFDLYSEINILVVDDNSPDGTAQEVKNLQSKYPNLHLLLREKKEGLGKAYLHAYRELLKKKDLGCVISMDADFSHNPKYIKQMLDEMVESDLVIGSRHMRGAGIKNYSWFRHFLSKMGSIYCCMVFRRIIWDWTNSFSCVKSEYLRKVDFSKIESFSGYAFIIALKYHLILAGVKFKEIPIIFEERREGQSKITGSIIWEEFTTPLKLVFRRGKK
ncbi:MAG: polyprenol monophosphomannose synthase [Candidatus Marinimicrobia bacterium]|nr:polyprenol monophosphomannose synthase [Candidatus Neomarinimicrobiota bacterium]